MVPTATGVLVILLGIWCQFGDYRRTLVSMMILSIFEASSAVDLPALGGASIPPAKVFMLFLVLRILSMRSGATSMISEMSPRRVLFLCLLLVGWVAASAVLLPRLFEGTTQVFALTRSEGDDGLAVATTLKPANGNLTQSFYAIGSFVLALGTCVLARKPGAYATVLSGLLWLTGLDIFFALADLATAATNTGFLLDIFHTGGYAFLTADESGGFKRISGTFSEASAFATFSLQLLAVNVALLIARVRPRLTAAYSIALAVLLFLSTSSTAYVGLAILAAGFGVFAVYALLSAGNARPLKVLGASACIGIFLGCIAFIAAPSMLQTAWTLLDVSIFQKGQSDSALERGSFNAQAAKIFWDTYGLGAGVGSTRTSNYILLLASNLGIIGLALFALMVLALTVLRSRPELDDTERGVVASARAGMLATLVPMVFIGATFDLGVLFYIFVGIIASSSPRGIAPVSVVSQSRGSFSRKREKGAPAKSPASCNLQPDAVCRAVALSLLDEPERHAEGLA